MAQTVWRGHLTFGLVSFPVRLYKAARAEKVSLRRLYRPSAPPPPVFDDEEPEPPPPPRRGQKAPEPVRAAAPEPPPEPEVFRTQNRIVAPSAPVMTTCPTSLRSSSILPCAKTRVCASMSGKRVVASS